MTPVLTHVVFFLVVSFVASLVMCANRLHDGRQIARETMRYFTSIVVGIAILGVVVVLLEWIFIRPLV